MPTIATF